MKILLIKKRKLLIFTVTLIFAGLLILIGYNRVISTLNMVTLNKVIILDPGHGGIDGGTVSRSGVKESQINLKITLKLRALLEQSGAIVFMTRDEDMGLYSESGTIRKKKNEDLRNRRELIENSEADLLVSIHLNSFPQSQYYGAQTFYPPNGNESKEAAELIQEELIRVLNNGNTRKSKVKSDVYLLQKNSIDRKSVV